MQIKYVEVGYYCCVATYVHILAIYSSNNIAYTYTYVSTYHNSLILYKGYFP